MECWRARATRRFGCAAGTGRLRPDGLCPVANFVAPPARSDASTSDPRARVVPCSTCRLLGVLRSSRREARSPTLRSIARYALIVDDDSVPSDEALTLLASFADRPGVRVYRRHRHGLGRHDLPRALSAVFTREGSLRTRDARFTRLGGCAGPPGKRMVAEWVSCDVAAMSPRASGF